MVEKKKRDNRERNINIIKAALGTATIGALGYALLKNKKLKNVVKDNNITQAVENKLTKQDLQDVVKSTVTNKQSINKAVNNVTKEQLQDVVTDAAKKDDYIPTLIDYLPKPKKDKSARNAVLDLINDPRAPKFKQRFKIGVDVDGFWRITPKGEKVWVKGHNRNIERTLKTKDNTKNVVEKSQVKPATKPTLRELLDEYVAPVDYVNDGQLTPSKRFANRNKNKVEKGYANKSTTTLNEDLTTLLKEDAKLRPQNLEDVIQSQRKQPTLQDKIRTTLANPNLPEPPKLLAPAKSNPKVKVDNESSIKQRLGEPDVVLDNTQLTTTKRYNNRKGNKVEKGITSRSKTKPNATLQQLLDERVEPKLEVDLNSQLRRQLKDVNKPQVKLPPQNKLEQQVKDVLGEPVITPRSIDEVLPTQRKQPTLQDKIRAALGNVNSSNEVKLLTAAKDNPKLIDNESSIKQQLGEPDVVADNNQLVTTKRYNNRKRNKVEKRLNNRSKTKIQETLRGLLDERTQPKLQVDVNNQLKRQLKNVNKVDVKLPKTNNLEQQIKNTLGEPVIVPRNIAEVLPPQRKEPTLQDKIREVLGKPVSNEQKLLPASRNNPPLRNTTQENIEQSLRPTVLSETPIRQAKLGKRMRLQGRKSIERSFFKPSYEELPSLQQVVDETNLPNEFIPTTLVKRAKLSKRYKQRNKNLAERVNKLELQKQVNDFNVETSIKNAEQSAIAKQGFTLQPISEVKTRQGLSDIRQARIETRLSKERKSQRIVDTFNNLQERVTTYERTLDEKTTQALQTKISQFEKRVSDVLTSAKSNKPRGVTTNKLNTQEYVRQIDGLQQQLEEYVNNPFVDDGVFGRIKTAKTTLGASIGKELSELNAKFKQVDVDDKTIKQLQKEYGDLLKTFAAKKEQLRAKSVIEEDDIAQRINLLQEELVGVNKDNVLQQTLDDKRSIQEQLSIFASRKNRGVTTRTERELERSMSDLTKASQNVATTRRRLQDTYNTQLENLTNLQQQLNSLPTNEGRLSKLQKSKLREVKQLGKTIGEDYARFRKLYSDAQQFEDGFEKRYIALSKEVADLNNKFETGVIKDNYFADIASDAKFVNSYQEKIQKDFQFLRKVYDPQSYDSYIQAVDGNIVGSPIDPSNTTSVKQAMRIKRQLLEGGYIEGKKYRPLYDEILISGNRLDNIVGNKKALDNLATTKSLVEKKQQELEELIGNYIDYKNNTLNQYDELYNRVVFLEDGDLAKMQQLRQNITNNNYASSFVQNQEVLENLSKTTDDIASYKPRYVYVGGEKVRRNVTPDNNALSLFQPGQSDVSKRRLVLQEVVKSDKTSDELNVATVNVHRKLARRAKQYTVNNRMTVAGLYFELEKRGIEIEGKNNFLKRMFDAEKPMSDAEKQVMSELSDPQRTMLRDFVESGSSDDFEKYHYHNTVNYLLSGKTDQGVNLSDELRETLRINENPITKNVRQYFTDSLDSNIVDKKLSEVNQVVRDLNSLGENVTINNTTTLDGTLSIDNLPPILPGETYKNRNFLVKKLQKIVGVNDDGKPTVDFSTALDLAGVSITNREQLREYITFMRKKGYGSSSYNNLALARKLNEDTVDEYSSRLYRYNFSQQQVEQAQFAQE